MSGMKIVLAYVLGWFVAQTTKFVLLALKGGATGKSFKDKVRLYFKSGGMPSGHAGSVIAATAYVGWSAGVNSWAYGVLVCMTVTILYDAVNVRYAVGEQGKKMNRLIKMVKPEDELVRGGEGHTIREVLVGGIIGVVMGWLTWMMVG